MARLLEQHGKAIEELVHSYYKLPWYKRFFYPDELAKLIELISPETNHTNYQIDKIWPIYLFFLTNHQFFQNWYFAVNHFLETPLFKALQLYQHSFKLNFEVFTLLALYPYPHHLEDLIHYFSSSKCADNPDYIQLLELAFIYQKKHPQSAISHWMPEFEDLYLKKYLKPSFLPILKQTHCSFKDLKKFLPILFNFRLNYAQWYCLLVDWGQLQRMHMVATMVEFGLLDAKVLQVICNIEEPLIALEYLEKMVDGGLMTDSHARQFFFWMFSENHDESYLQQVFEVLQTLKNLEQVNFQVLDFNLENIIVAKQPLSLLKAVLEPESKIILNKPVYGKKFLELAALSNAPYEFFSELCMLYRMGGFLDGMIDHLIDYFVTAKSDVASVSEALCFVYDSKLFFDANFWKQFAKLEFPHIWSRYTNCLLLNFSLNSQEVMTYSQFLMYSQHLDMSEVYCILLDIKKNENLFNFQQTQLLNLLFRANENFKDFYSSLKFLAQHHIYPDELENLDLSALGSVSRIECSNALISLKTHGLNQPMFQSVILQCYHFSKIKYGLLYYHQMLTCLLVFKDMGLLNGLQQLNLTEFLSYQLEAQSETLQQLLKVTQSETLLKQIIEGKEYSPGYLDCAITLLKPILEQKCQSQASGSIAN